MSSGFITSYLSLRLLVVRGMTRTSQFTPIASGSAHCTSRVRPGSKGRLGETDQRCWLSSAAWAVFLDRKNSCTKKPMAAETPEPSSVTSTDRSESE
jgi:hypothetical protein